MTERPSSYRSAPWAMAAAFLGAVGCFDPSPGQLDAGGSSGGTTSGSTSGPGPDSTSAASEDASASGSTTLPDGSGTETTGPDDLTESTTESTTESMTGSTGPQLGCGNGMIDMGEDCDDAGESASCDADCTFVECGDMTVNAAAQEGCDDGNDDPTDACIACVPASCGDGFIWAGNEECDDGNATDLDACNNACAFGSILVSGNANNFLSSALTTLGESFVSENQDWPVPLSAGVIIMGRDGGGATAPDYQAHLDAGAHLLVAGGSSSAAFGDWINLFFSSTGSLGWHQSDTCVDDWSTVGVHPITGYLPPTHEFSDQNITFHMVHFNEVGQPPQTELLGRNCEAGPDNYVLVTRRFPSGGTFTYLATDIGLYDGPGTQADFVEPFFQGYLEYLRTPAP